MKAEWRRVAWWALLAWALGLGCGLAWRAQRAYERGRVDAVQEYFDAHIPPKAEPR